MNQVHIFKAGCHTAMNGAEFCFSPLDLARAAISYDPARHRAPLVLGHPATDDPAHGWIARLEAVGNDLVAFAEQVTDELVGWVRDGRYLAVSAAFFLPGDPRNPVPSVYYLRHVGFLGATPPAVKGLREPAFADDCATTLVDIGPACSCAFAAPDAPGEDPFLGRLKKNARILCAACPSLSYSDAVVMAYKARDDWDR